MQPAQRENCKAGKRRYNSNNSNNSTNSNNSNNNTMAAVRYLNRANAAILNNSTVLDTSVHGGRVTRHSADSSLAFASLGKRALPHSDNCFLCLRPPICTPLNAVISLNTATSHCLHSHT